jgi:hypothetical protein
MNLVAESVPGVKADTSVVSTTYITRNGENRVNFYGKPFGKWTAGKYRADIYINGKLSRNLSFDIKDQVGTSTDIKAFKPLKRANPIANQPRRNPYIHSTATNVKP